MSPFLVLRRAAGSTIDAVCHHGSPGRTRLLGLLGAVFGLQAADSSTLGATAPLLETGLGFSHAQIGALASTSAVVGVLATLPSGVLADRVNRVGLLRIVVVLWTVGMVWVGLSSTFAMMLMARAMLGAVTAATGPATGSKRDRPANSPARSPRPNVDTTGIYVTGSPICTQVTGPVFRPGRLTRRPVGACHAN